MKKLRKKPPGLASWLLKVSAVHDEPFPIQGDFDEEYDEIVRKKGTAAARRWYWGHFFRSFPFLIKDAVYWRFVMFRNYLKSALRHIKQHKGYSFINVSGLAIGMACCRLKKSIFTLYMEPILLFMWFFFQRLP